MVELNECDAVVTAPERIAVIGGGYVGAPTAAILAHFGHAVVIAESDPERRALLAAGRAPMMEEGLSELLTATIATGRLEVVADAAHAVENVKFAFLCVNTPMGDDGRADLTEIDAASRQIGPALAAGSIVVNKSTVPVGTAERVAGLIGRRDVTVVSNPEFLSEGTAIRNSLNPERTVVGSSSAAAALAVSALFAPTQAPVVATDARSAEVIKYAANAFLATKLSFVNSIAQLCDALGADVGAVVDGLGRDPRIGAAFLRPGPGWGGPCLPKDASAMLAIATDAGVEMPIVAAAIVANELQRTHVVDAVEALLGESISSTTVSLLGLTFKAGTADRRNSPALAIAHELLHRGAEVRAFDPTVPEGDASTDLSGIKVVGSVEAAVNHSDVIVVATEWAMFASLDLRSLAAAMARPRLFDARGVVDLAAARQVGFDARALGRP